MDTDYREPHPFVKAARLLAPIFMVLLSCPVARCDDSVVSIDQGARVITVDHGGALRVYRFGPFTDVTINGMKASISQLRAGTQVAVTLSDQQTIAKISARGNLPTRPAGSPTPFSGFDDIAANGIHHLKIKMLLDANDNVKVRAGRLWIEHVDWSQPTAISINGVPWVPKWTNNVTDFFTGFSAPLAPFGDSKISVVKLKGRGTVAVLEPPTSKNNQTLTIHFADKDGASGADPHEAVISW